jgi:hypothetical protein
VLVRLSLVLFALAGVTNAAPVVVDRAVLRFSCRETGGVDAPRFIFERELAFESRIEALSDGDTGDGATPFRPRHEEAALERHIAETVLESLDIEPPPTEPLIASRVDEARLALIERVGGVVPLREAALAEGIASSEISRLLRRQALASIYLDRMVAPMLAPTDAELRVVARTQRTPFSGRPYEEIESALRRWYVGGKLTAAVGTYYDGLRTRLTLTVLR